MVFVRCIIYRCGCLLDSCLLQEGAMKWMADRKNVIEGLKCCTQDHCALENCPYWEHGCEHRLKLDALELLQMSPQLSNNNAVAPYYKYPYGLDTACGNCGNEVERYCGHKYCPHCGCLIDWKNIMPYKNE